MVGSLAEEGFIGRDRNDRAFHVRAAVHPHLHLVDHDPDHGEGDAADEDGLTDRGYRPEEPLSQFRAEEEGASALGLVEVVDESAAPLRHMRADRLEAGHDPGQVSADRMGSPLQIDRPPGTLGGELVDFRDLLA